MVETNKNFAFKSVIFLRVHIRGGIPCTCYLVCVNASTVKHILIKLWYLRENEKRKNRKNINEQNMTIIIHPVNQICSFIQKNLSKNPVRLVYEHTD